MLANVLLSLAVLLLFSLTAARCLESWGLPLPGRLAVPASGQAGAVRPMPSRGDLWKVFVGALALRVLLLAAMAGATAFANGDGLTAESFLGKFTLWDARHYVNLIEQGYTQYQEEGRHIFLVFYPLYVWVSRLVGLAVPSTVGAGLLVSVVSYAWGCCWVYRLAGRLFGQDVARSAVLFLSSFPFSFFFGTVMTEGLFLLTTAAAVACAAEKKWLSFGIWGALAALTRMTGILVILPAGIALLGELRPLAAPAGQSLKNAIRPFVRKLPFLLLPLLGAGGYLLLNWQVDGSFFAFAGHQGHWNQGGMWASKVLVYIWRYFSENMGQPMGWAVWLPELVLVGVFFTVLALSAWKGRTPPGLLAYGFCYLIANYSLSWLLSAGRYMSCGFPLFIMMAVLTEKRPLVRDMWILGQGVLLGVYLFGYVNNGPIM